MKRFATVVLAGLAVVALGAPAIVNHTPTKTAQGHVGGAAPTGIGRATGPTHTMGNVDARDRTSTVFMNRPHVAPDPYVVNHLPNMNGDSGHQAAKPVTAP